MTKRSRKLLLFGASGKMGSAIRRAFARGYEIVEVGRHNLDAEDLAAVTALVEREAPDLLVNTIAMLGIDACENDPERARRLNALLPWRLAELSREHAFTLAHLSSDAVFGNAPDHLSVESDPAAPINVYGRTKLQGDAFVQAGAPRGYVFRTSVLFGESAREDQFVEKMLARVRGGAKRLEISHDVITTPSYTRDVAAEMRWILESERPPGLYHVVNAGAASLHEMIRELATQLALDVEVVPVSHRQFPCVGRKNTHTTMGSERVAPLRPWQEAFRAYCSTLRRQGRQTVPKATSTRLWPRVQLGIDLDNTLICYDDLFHRLAVERGYVDPCTAPAKRAVRDAMWARGLEEEWTGIQAIAYGSRLHEARAFPGAIETLRALHQRGVEMVIVSHKTRHPARGYPVDLRAKALGWLRRNAVLDARWTGIDATRVFFEDDQQAKRQRISALGCTHFIDDLREFLLAADFPAGVRRLLFDPSGAASGDANVEALAHWNQLRERLVGKPMLFESPPPAYRSA